MNLSLSRRRFIQGSGVLTIGFAVGGKGMLAKVAVADETKSAAFSPNAFLTINEDNTVNIVINHAEMGQGIYTALSQIIADELDADWSQVHAKHLTELKEEYGNLAFGGIIGTGGSTSTNSEWDRFRNVGATARAMLVEAAAQTWGVDAKTLKTELSHVINENGEKLSYGELTGKASALEAPEHVDLKKPEDYIYIGKDVRRIEGQSKVNGSAQFGMDMDLPDMLIAVIAHSPVFGGKVKSYNDENARNMPGVHKIVQTANGVAVVADTFWQAKNAKDALQIEWDEGEFASVSTADLWKNFDELSQQQGAPFKQSGTIDSAKASKEISGGYRFPYLAHAPMEPLNATVQVKDGVYEMWAGTQFPTVDAMNIAAAVGTEPENVRINVQWLGGGFGRRAVPNSDFMVQAAEIAKAAELPNPIKMIWLREDDIQGGFYRPMYLHRYTVGVDESGYPINWQHIVVGQSIMAGTLFSDVMVHDGVDHTSVEGMSNLIYPVENTDFSLHSPEVPVSVLWWRSVGHTHTAPVVEGIINRLAKEAGVDPFEYRRNLLKENEAASRHLGVLDVLEEKSGWKEAPEDGVFRGMAVHESFGSVCGYVVELKKTDNQLSFHKVTAAIDCGVVVNPENVKAQVFGAAAYGLSSVMGQEITIKDGKPEQTNFHNYPVVKLAQMPLIEVHTVDTGQVKPTGVGEPGLPPFIPAFLAAINEATGQEITELPLKLESFEMV